MSPKVKAVAMGLGISLLAMFLVNKFPAVKKIVGG